MVTAELSAAAVQERRVTVIVAAVVTLLALGLAAVVALTIAGKPVSTVLYLIGGFTATTIPSLLTLAVVKDTNQTVKNGLRTAIATETAARVAQDARSVAGELAQVTSTAAAELAAEHADRSEAERRLAADPPTPPEGAAA